MIRLPGLRCALGASSSSWPRFTSGEMRALVLIGQEMYRRGYPAPKPVSLLRNPDGYYLRLAYLCEAERSKAAVSRMARREAA